LHPTSKEWVVFVHGAGGSASIWFKQIKEFKNSFNILILDLRGHGQSDKDKALKNYTFRLIVNDVAQLLDAKKIDSAHFIGISLGSMLSKLLAYYHPQKVKSLVLGGSIVRLNIKSRVLLNVGNAVKHIVPYMWLYRVFATIILPRKNHEQSRILFIKEAMRMDQREFLKWFGLTKELPSVLKKVNEMTVDIPTLFIQGEQDHMFLRDLRQSLFGDFYRLEVIKSCGHVVNVEQSEIFNSLAVSFLLETIEEN
jgi:pimeloyl-ACP methyl ester carboxylesterase